MKSSTDVSQPTFAPQGCADLAAYARRLWAAGGVAPNTAGGVVPEGGMKPNTVWYTEIDADITASPNGDQLNNWKLNNIATNPVNNIIIGEETPDDWLVRLLPMERSMLILKRHSVWVLTGSGPDSFTVRQLDSARGCVDPRAVVSVRGVAYWISDEGLVSWDGAEVQVLSDRVGEHMKVSATTGQGGTFPPLFYLWALPNDYLWMQVITEADFDAAFYHTAMHHEHQSMLYHIGTKRWSHFVARLNHDASDSYNEPDRANITSVWGANGRVFGSGGSGKTWELSHTTDPTGMTETQQASNPLGLDKITSSTYVEIPAEVHLPPVRLAFPIAKAALRQLLFEYSLVWANIPPDQRPEFTAMLHRYGITPTEAGTVGFVDYGDELTIPSVSQADMDGKMIVKQWSLPGREVNDFYISIERLHKLAAPTGVTHQRLNVPSWWGRLVVDADFPAQRPTY